MVFKGSTRAAPWENKLFFVLLSLTFSLMCVYRRLYAQTCSKTSLAPRNAYKFKSPAFNLDNNYLWRRLLCVSRGPSSFVSLFRSWIINSEGSCSNCDFDFAELAKLIFHERLWLLSNKHVWNFDSTSASSSRHVDGIFYEKCYEVEEHSESKSQLRVSANCFRSPFKLQMTFYHANLFSNSSLMLRETFEQTIRPCSKLMIP